MEMKAVLLFISILLSSGLYAQSVKGYSSANYIQRGHEFSISIGGYPTGAALAKGFYKRGCYDYDMAYHDGYDRYHDYRNQGISIGTIYLQYTRNFNRRAALTVNVGFDKMFGAVYDGYTHQKKGGQNAFGVVIFPEYRQILNPGNRVKLYAGAGIGVGFYHNFDTSFRTTYVSETETYEEEYAESSVPIIQFTPIGLTFGTKFFFFAETQVGSAMFGGRAGVGYRF